MHKITVLTAIATGVLALLVGCAPSRMSITAERNPTTNAGRGEPSLDDEQRPSAWILIDGHEGRFVEQDGEPQIQWVIDEPVSPTPTLRVEAFKPLLGKPKDFKCVLITYKSAEGPDVGYGIAAKDGAFKVGRVYPLLDPGPGFEIRIADTSELIDRIEPLQPGEYLVSAKIENHKLDAKTLAVTHFTVAESQVVE